MTDANANARNEPERYFINPREVTPADMLALFTNLTGREPSAAEVAEFREQWARLRRMLRGEAEDNFEPDAETSGGGS